MNTGKKEKNKSNEHRDDHKCGEKEEYRRNSKKY